MIKRIVLPLAVCLAGGANCPVQGQELQDDLSRSYLANYAASFDPGWRSLPYPFKFPDDARESSIFGIDVSHYQGQIDWGKLPDQKVLFVYVKATQGDKRFDPNFSGN